MQRQTLHLHLPGADAGAPASAPGRCRCDPPGIPGIVTLDQQPCVCHCAHHALNLFVPSYRRTRNTHQYSVCCKRFPNCLRAIDGTHIKIHKPTVMYSEDFYCVRKGSNTMQMQAVCVDRGYFWDVLIGRPGSCHDSM
eukprot:365772-Chlamydomonas_euryale.AAC.8